MKRRAPNDHGATGAHFSRRILLKFNEAQRGFTLLEMCAVIFIMVLLVGMSMPAMQSTFVEHAVRADSRQVSLMVKMAMLQSADRHQAYAIDLTPTTISLHPAGNADGIASKDKDEASSDQTVSTQGTDDSDSSAAPHDIVMSDQLESPNKIMVPDPEKLNAWMPIPETRWLFQPGELCPATRVRISHGDSWLEMNFNPLTGNVENEDTYFQ